PGAEQFPRRELMQRLKRRPEIPPTLEALENPRLDRRGPVRPVAPWPALGDQSLFSDQEQRRILEGGTILPPPGDHTRGPEIKQDPIAIAEVIAITPHHAGLETDKVATADRPARHRRQIPIHH